MRPAFIRRLNNSRRLPESKNRNYGRERRSIKLTNPGQTATAPIGKLAKAKNSDFESSIYDYVNRIRDDNIETANFLENVPIPIHSITKELIIVDVNSAWLNMFGYESHDVIGQKIDKFISEDSLAKIKECSIVYDGSAGIHKQEFTFLHKNGTPIYVNLYCVEHSRNNAYFCMLQNIKPQKIAENTLKSIIKIARMLGQATVDDIIKTGIEEGQRLTGSKIGFLHFVSDDQKSINLFRWSDSTLKNCLADSSESHYSIEKAGVWVDCVHQRKPVIHNDYAGLPHKKGLPEGHINLMRDLTVPVFENDKIVAIIGMGNKNENYDDFDINQLALLAENIWGLVQRIRAEEERSRLFNLSPDFQCVASTDGYFKQTNPAVKRILGWTTEEITSKPWINFVHPEDVEKTKMACDQLQQGHSVLEFENRYKCKDGSYRWLSWNSIPVPEKELIYAVVRDITESKTTQQALKESEAKYRRIFENIHDGYIETSMNGIILEASPSMEKILGYTRYDLVGNSSEIVYMDPGRRPELINHLLKHGWLNDYEVGMRSKNGEDIICSINSKLLYGENGKPLKIVTTLRDITRRKAAEDERERLILELKQALTKVKTLSGLLPICSYCKNVRDDKGYWTEVEAYVSDHSGAEFTHSICPDCMKKEMQKIHNNNESKDRIS